MKLTKERLKQIIREELETLSEGPLEAYMQSEKAQKDWERFISGGMFSGGQLGKLIAKGQATASWDVEEFKNLYLKEYWAAGMEGHQDPNRVAGNVPVSYKHLRAHETRHALVCRIMLEK